MDDGAVLLADRWVAQDDADRPQPTVLVRSPYGRRGFFGLLHGRMLAERGLQVLVQSVRGTFGSGGEFSPFDERADGLATLRWIAEQPWHEGKVGTTGASYLGLVQWALAPEAGPILGAMAPSVTASQFHGQSFAGGSMSLESAASWLVLVTTQERRLAPVHMLRGMRRLETLLDDLPIGELDEQATGEPLPWYRDALAQTRREDAYWVARDYSAGVGSVTAPVLLTGGWYDIFLPWMVEDFVALREAGRAPQLVIGPWAHTSPGLMAKGARESLAWMRAHLLGDDRLLSDAAVRVFRTGEEPEWVELPDWPPPGARETRWALGAGDRLAPEPTDAGDPGPEAAVPSRYRYDPADPTPAVGGPVLLTRDPVVDNRELEERDDVLVFTSAPLTEPLTAMGPVRAEIFVRASLPHFDVFVRLCDVDEKGVSRNVCDGLLRVEPGRCPVDDDGVCRVSLDLWPTAHRFGAGHRLRVLVASGAHPRFARNHGTGEPIATATRMLAADLEVFHDAQRPSAVVFGVVD